MLEFESTDKQNVVPWQTQNTYALRLLKYRLGGVFLATFDRTKKRNVEKFGKCNELMVGLLPLLKEKAACFTSILR